MQQINEALGDLAVIGALDPRRYFPASARKIASRILKASDMHLMHPDEADVRRKAEALSIAIRDYADAIEKLIKEKP